MGFKTKKNIDVHWYVMHIWSHKETAQSKIRTAALLCPVSFADERDGHKIK
jgi:hypothetical protein